LAPEGLETKYHLFIRSFIHVYILRYSVWYFDVLGVSRLITIFRESHSAVFLHRITSCGHNYCCVQLLNDENRAAVKIQLEYNENTIAYGVKPNTIGNYILCPNINDFGTFFVCSKFLDQVMGVFSIYYGRVVAT
jgi:hypothetical protein